MMGQLVCTSLQFPIAHLLVFVDQCGGFWSLSRLFRNEFVQAEWREVSCGLIPLAQQLLSLCFTQQIQLAHQLSRISNDAA